MDKIVNIHIPDVSVIMPVYNGAKYLREAIGSILEQTLPDFEFIIINDGSTDNSEEIILSFKDERIVFIKNEINIGLIESLNKGLKAAKAEYIARMDADDVAVVDRLELQLKEFKEHPGASVVGSDYFLLSGVKLSVIHNRSDSDYQKAVLFFSPCFCHPTVMIKNIFSEKDISYKRDYVHAEDYKLWTDLAAFGEFRNVNVPLLKYRSHNDQVSAKNKETQLKISERIRKEYCDRLKFSLTEEQFIALNTIGNNAFITSIKTLEDIEKCLLHLKEENQKHRSFNERSFNIFLHKFWFDSCGHTNLGLAAYSLYNRSPISKVVKISLEEKSRLLAKCMVRKFRKA